MYIGLCYTIVYCVACDVYVVFDYVLHAVFCTMYFHRVCHGAYCAFCVVHCVLCIVCCDLCVVYFVLYVMRCVL